MLISVVIPVFNIDCGLLKRSMNSILEANNADVEVVVVDDGSDVSYSKDYEDICGKNLMVRYIRKENGGPSSARNYGVDNASGEYVMFLDADDYLTPNCISEAVAGCSETRADIIMGYVYKKLGGCCVDSAIYEPHNVFEPVVVMGDIQKSKLLNHLLWYTDDSYKMDFGYISDGPVARLFRRSLFEDNRFDLIPVWNEDTLWNIGLIKSAERIVVSKSIWYIYDVRTESVTQGFRQNCIEEFNYIIKEVCEAGNSLWNGLSDKGIYYRVWHDIFLLSRCYIFHSENNDCFLKKYDDLKKVIKGKYYKKAISEVDFSHDNKLSKRIVKETLRFFMLIHFYLLTYLTLDLYTNRKHA